MVLLCTLQFQCFVAGAAADAGADDDNVVAIVTVVVGVATKGCKGFLQPRRHTVRVCTPQQGKKQRNIAPPPPTTTTTTTTTTRRANPATPNNRYGFPCWDERNRRGG